MQYQSGWFAMRKCGISGSTFSDHMPGCQAWGTVPLGPLPCNSSGPWAKLQLSPFEHCPWFWKYRHSMVLKLPWIAARQQFCSCKMTVTSSPKEKYDPKDSKGLATTHLKKLLGASHLPAFLAIVVLACVCGCSFCGPSWENWQFSPLLQKPRCRDISSPSGSALRSSYWSCCNFKHHLQLEHIVIYSFPSCTFGNLAWQSTINCRSHPSPSRVNQCIHMIYTCKTDHLNGPEAEGPFCQYLQGIFLVPPGSLAFPSTFSGIASGPALGRSLGCSGTGIFSTLTWRSFGDRGRSRDPE